MQCQRRAWRTVCRAGNAYNPSLALRTAFGSNAKRQVDDEPIPSSREPTEWEELKTNETPSEQQDTTLHDSKTQATGGLVTAELGEIPSRPTKSNIRRSRSGHTAHVRKELHEEWNLQGSNKKQKTDAETWKEDMARLVSLNRKNSQDKRRGRPVPDQEKPLLKASFDYAPKVIEPSRPILGFSRPAPWQTPPETVGRNTRYLMSEEITSLAQFIRPTVLERVARVAATQEVMSFLRRKVPCSKSIALDMNGSERTGLAVATSDIDIRVSAKDGNATKWCKPKMCSIMTGRMRQIQGVLEKSERFTAVTMRGGLHPIVTFYHRHSGLDFQLVATGSTRPQEDLTRKYLDELPFLDDLFVFMRTFFEVRGLLPVNNGGIGSYGCFVMLLPPLLRSMVGHNMSVGDALRTVLAYYDPSQAIDPYQQGVACFPRQRFKRHDFDSQFGDFIRLAQLRGDQVRAGQWRMSPRDEYQPYLLAIQDPADPYNDLGARTHAIKHIIVTLQQAHQDIRSWARMMDGASNPHAVYRSIVTQLLGRPDLLYRQRRKILSDYGVAVLGEKFVATLPKKATTIEVEALMRDVVRSVWIKAVRKGCDATQELAK